MMSNQNGLFLLLCATSVCTSVKVTTEIDNIFAGSTSSETKSPSASMLAHDSDLTFSNAPRWYAIAVSRLQTPTGAP